jgi:hypothetical protein
MSNCQLEVRYICKKYVQLDCPFFKSREGMTTTSCHYGFPDRKCQSKKAKKEALIAYLKKINDINLLSFL